MLQKATALPLCSVTDILWYRHVVSSGSLVIVVIRPSRSSMNSADCGQQAPLVSMATETKECVVARATYFVVLLTVAFSAAAQAVVEVSCWCDAAYVSGTVTSQANGLPRVHGTRVAIIINIIIIIILSILGSKDPEGYKLKIKSVSGVAKLRCPSRR